MKLSERSKRTIALTLVGSMFVSTTPVFATDYTGHWAERTIEEWKDKGIINGYNDGSFRPANNITRAEFATMLARIFGLIVTEGAEEFTDITGYEWYAKDVRLVSAAGFMTGIEGHFRPKEIVTREEAAYAMATAYHMTGETEKKFKDQEDISAWAEDEIEALVARGYINGYPDGTLRPQKGLTYAEALVMLDNITSEIIDIPGTYTQNIQGNLVINKEDVILKDTIIDGNLYLTEGIGEGDVTLENVKVTGTTIIEGGGVNSVKVKKSELGTVVIDKAVRPVRLAGDEQSKVDKVVVASPVLLEGKVEQVEIATSQEVKVVNAVVKEMLIVAEEAKVVLDEEVAVEKLVANASSEIFIEGKLIEAVVNADNVIFHRKPEKIEVAPGISDPTIVEKPNTPTTPSTGEDSSESTPSEKPQIDKEAPVLTYKGEKRIEVEQGKAFTMPEVTATDNVDKNVEVKVSITDKDGKVVDTINTKELGSYTLTYNATDEAGNKAEPLKIQVIVVDKEAPVLTYKGETKIEVEQGTDFKIPEVTATDNVDKNVEVKVVITDKDGQVVDEINTKELGTYTITYSATDAADNRAKEITITVEVTPVKINIEDIKVVNETEITFTSSVDPTKLTVKWNDTEAVKVEEVAGDATVSSVTYSVTYQVKGMRDLNKLEVSADDYASYVKEEIKPEFEWKDSIDTTWYNPAEMKFTISTASQLAGLAKLVNDGDSFSRKTITLGNDIDLLKLEWTPIGGEKNPFSGKFDGDERIISNLQINKTNDYVGLFGKMDGGSIENVKLEKVGVSGGSYVGSLVGWSAGGIISRCTVTHSKVEAKGDSVGGIVGYSYTNISDCKASNLTVTGNQNIGGIVGFLAEPNYTVNRCVVENINVEGFKEVGGIVGAANGEKSKIVECIVKGEGNIRGGQMLGGAVGGIVGSIWKGITIENCYVNKQGLTISGRLKGWYAGGKKKKFWGLTREESIASGDINFIDNTNSGCNFSENQISSLLLNEEFYIEQNLENEMGETEDGENVQDAVDGENAQDTTDGENVQDTVDGENVQDTIDGDNQIDKEIPVLRNF